MAPATAEPVKPPRQHLDRQVNGGRYWNMVRVQLTPEAREGFTRLPKGMRPRVARLIGRVGNWPDVSGAKALSGELAGHYRLRTGDYRVQLTARRDGDDWVVVVEKIGHRDGFYND